MGAFDHLEWTYDGAFEQLFSLGRGEFEQNFPKIQMPGGLPGGDVEASIWLVHYTVIWVKKIENSSEDKWIYSSYENKLTYRAHPTDNKKLHKSVFDINPATTNDGLRCQESFKSSEPPYLRILQLKRYSLLHDFALRAQLKSFAVTTLW